VPIKLQDPDGKVYAPSVAGCDDTSEMLVPMEEISPFANNGRVFTVADVGKTVAEDKFGRGTLMWIGKHATKGKWRCGIALEGPTGTNDGSLPGKGGSLAHRYFRCDEGHGIICHPAKVTILDEQDPVTKGLEPVAPIVPTEAQAAALVATERAVAVLVTAEDAVGGGDGSEQEPVAPIVPTEAQAAALVATEQAVAVLVTAEDAVGSGDGGGTVDNILPKSRVLADALVQMVVGITGVSAGPLAQHFAPTFAVAIDPGKPGAQVVAASNFGDAAALVGRLWCVSDRRFASLPPLPVRGRADSRGLLSE
jgi:hypothetical protein